MMRSITLQVLLAGVAFLALDGCRDAGDTHGDGSPRVGSRYVPDSSVGFRQCSPDDLDSKTVVRVAIASDFSTKVGRSVHYKRYAQLSSSKDDLFEYNDKPTINGSSDSVYTANPFHVDVSTLPPDQSGYIKVRVFLLNPAYTFQPLAAGPHGPRIMGVSRQYDDKYERWYCQNSSHQIEPNGHGQDVLTFFIKNYDPDTKLKPVDAQINLHVIAKSGSGKDTPLIIDPKIRNNG